MNRPMVSIIIPVYNVQDYLEECIDSLLNQTYKNIEIITIDDGSTDSSLKILMEYEKKINNLKVIKQGNEGQSIARNNGIKIAEGKYIYFLDSDDYLSKYTIENLVLKMERNDLDLIRFSAKSFTKSKEIKINNHQYDFSKYFESNKIYSKEEFIRTSLRAYSASPVLYMVKKDIITKHKILFRPGIIHEDQLFTLQVFLNVNKSMYDPGRYYNRRLRPNSIMTSKDIKSKEKSFLSYVQIYKQMLIMLNDNKKYEEISLINARLKRIASHLIYSDVNKKLKKLEIRRLRKFSKIGWFIIYIKKYVRKYYIN
jgi:glycosyltransferase involved in cell wall biosynthesis